MLYEVITMGKTAEAVEWLELAPNEELEFSTMER